MRSIIKVGNTIFCKPRGRMNALTQLTYPKTIELKVLLIAAIVMAVQALSPAHATKPSSEPFALIERQRITETIEPNGTVV